ncbi:MAG: hypothetical protein KDH86_14410, partial [Anaerolineae bacterium]|nr:hypothetical protein [Anaerolineae bacterium]
MNMTDLFTQSIYPDSTATVGDVTYLLLRAEGSDDKRLGILGDSAGFEGERQGDLLLCPLTAGNAAALRAVLPWLQARPL